MEIIQILMDYITHIDPFCTDILKLSKTFTFSLLWVKLLWAPQIFKAKLIFAIHQTALNDRNNLKLLKNVKIVVKFCHKNIIF